jgi:hypothetical protein
VHSDTWVDMVELVALFVLVAWIAWLIARHHSGK